MIMKMAKYRAGEIKPRQIYGFKPVSAFYSSNKADHRETQIKCANSRQICTQCIYMINDTAKRSELQNEQNRRVEIFKSKDNFDGLMPILCPGQNDGTFIMKYKHEMPTNSEYLVINGGNLGWTPKLQERRVTIKEQMLRLEKSKIER